MAKFPQGSTGTARRDFLKRAGVAGLGAAGLALGAVGWQHERTPDPIKVGVLHSLSGSMAISETPLCDAALLAIEELNAAGGVLGRPVQAIVEDGASDPAEFSRKCAALLAQDRVCSIFGCWTSACRKAMLPALEHYNGLLWYPVQYEGNECTNQVIYTGSTPHQQVFPSVLWLLHNGHRRLYLLGSDYVYPRTANRIVRAVLAEAGHAAVGEEYVPEGTRDFTATIARIRAARPDVVFSTINGASNRALYRQFHDAGLAAADVPIMAMSMAEAEIRYIDPAATTGHYAAWAYFESLPGAANRAFIAKFQNRYGDRRVTDDPMEAAYFQVKLWAQAVRQAQSTTSGAIRQAAAGQTLQAPEGRVQIDPVNRHTWKWLRIGQIQSDGQIAVRYSSVQPLDPNPWLPQLNGNRACNWPTGQVVPDSD
ncbi:MAG TPA: urea ABC transporter substrate-binding protein [Terriglobales bacterium]|jgi:urea transport system substrate-binding protein